MEVVSLRNSPPILSERHPSHSSNFSIPTKTAVSVRGGRAHFLARSRAARDRNVPLPEKQRDKFRHKRWIAEEEDEFECIEAAMAKYSAEEDQPEESVSESDSSAAFLSLSVKPDRNMALLDDYEMEEFAFDSHLNHRSGYVAVVGKPNVGKSTLSNQMIGQKLSIVTDKPQTTRHRILGICSGPDYQMVLYDTPGVIEKKMHMLDSMMMKNVRSAAVNADCILIVVDASKMPDKMEEVLEEGFGTMKEKLPTLLVLNKKDLIKPGEIAKKLEWYEKFTDVDEVIPVSAKFGLGVEDVKDWILSNLPMGPPLYPKDIASEHPERFFVAEIVREKMFMQYRNEVPYACQEGRALKLLATAARLDIEDFLQKKVFLEVEVKVKENWRQDEGLLKRYGYGGKIRA